MSKVTTSQSNFVAQFALPPSLCKSIGRLITRYAYVEHYVQGIVYMLAEIDGATGRLVAREPRLSDRLDLVLDLAAYRNLTIAEDVDAGQLREAIVDAEDMRNLCAHSAWTHADELHKWVVVKTTGNWEGEKKTDRKRRSKRIRPQGQLVDASTINEYIAGMEAILATFRKMKASLEAQLRASQEKSHSP